MRLPTIIAILLLFTGSGFSDAKGPQKNQTRECGFYRFPVAIDKKPFHFLGELVPLKRPDIEERVLFQINYLLLDARGALTDWLFERDRHTWQFEEIFVKEDLPKEFALLSPVIAGLASKAEFKGAGAGWWFLPKNCGESEGLSMSEDSWHDDRFDLELSTKCFAANIKNIHAELGLRSWLMTTAAYLNSTKMVKEYIHNWNTDVFWDIPFPDSIEDIICRWIAFSIIYHNKDYYGLTRKVTTPFIYDQISGVELQKDISVGELAQMVGISPRETLELNPKLKSSPAIFPATSRGRPLVHSIAVPKNKGRELLKKLKQQKYLTDK